MPWSDFCSVFGFFGLVFWIPKGSPKIRIPNHKLKPTIDHLHSCKLTVRWLENPPNFDGLYLFKMWFSWAFAVSFREGSWLHLSIVSSVRRVHHLDPPWLESPAWTLRSVHPWVRCIKVPPSWRWGDTPNVVALLKAEVGEVMIDFLVTSNENDLKHLGEIEN